MLEEWSLFSVYNLQAEPPWLLAEDPFELPALEPEYAWRWIIQTARHCLDKAGFVTRLSLERPR